jgi:hypothetical protein
MVERQSIAQRHARCARDLLTFVAKRQLKSIECDRFRYRYQPLIFKRSVMENNFAQTALDSQLAAGEEMSDYVAHLQMHMALQARNLVPTLTNALDSREQFLHQTQAHFEKLASRQMC